MILKFLFVILILLQEVFGFVSFPFRPKIFQTLCSTTLQDNTIDNPSTIEKSPLPVDGPSFTSKSASSSIKISEIVKSIPTNGLITNLQEKDPLLFEDSSFSFSNYFNETSYSERFSFHPLTSFQLLKTKFNFWKQYPWRKIRHDIILKAKIGGTIPLQATPNPFLTVALSEKEYEKVESLQEITRMFLFAASDPRVKGLLLEVSPLSCGYSKLFEIIRLIHYYKQSGKPIIAFSEINSEKELLLSSQCDKHFMPPDGILDLRGISSSISFYRDLLDKIGIESQVQRYGKYKSFGDIFNRQNMSEEQREVMTSLLLQSSQLWISSISEILKKNITQVLHLWKKDDYHQQKMEDGRNASFSIFTDGNVQNSSLSNGIAENTSVNVPASSRHGQQNNTEAFPASIDDNNSTSNGDNDQLLVKTLEDYSDEGLISGILYYDQVEKLIETLCLSQDKKILKRILYSRTNPSTLFPYLTTFFHFLLRNYCLQGIL
jgi:hypothetical protein